MSRLFASGGQSIGALASASVVGTQTWITVMLNGLLWKQTKIILLLMKLHPGGSEVKVSA